MINYEQFDLGDVTLLSGKILRSAKLAYKTYGTLNAKCDNVILLPTFYTGTHKRNEGFFGASRAINPEQHFIVSINMFGNGFSSSPSNTHVPQDGSRFPLVTIRDNVTCQYRLLIEHLGNPFQIIKLIEQKMNLKSTLIFSTYNMDSFIARIMGYNYQTSIIYTENTNHVHKIQLLFYLQIQCMFC